MVVVALAVLAASGSAKAGVVQLTFSGDVQHILPIFNADPFGIDGATFGVTFSAATDASPLETGGVPGFNSFALYEATGVLTLVTSTGTFISNPFAATLLAYNSESGLWFDQITGWSTDNFQLPVDSNPDASLIVEAWFDGDTVPDGEPEIPVVGPGEGYPQTGYLYVDGNGDGDLNDLDLWFGKDHKYLLTTNSVTTTVTGGGDQTPMVPEPGTLALMGLGGFGLLGGVLRKRRKPVTAG